MRLCAIACASAYANGVLLVAAAGNEGYGVDNVNQPAIFDSVIAVAAIDPYDGWAWFSSTGPTVELAAPGVDINSTWPGGGYAVYEGTSMACPHVSGAAALVIASGIGSPAAVRERLRLTAQDLGTPGWDEYFGFGLVRVDWAAGDYEVVVTGINPNLGTNDRTVSVTISGLGFEPGAVPQLARAGASPITGTGVTVLSGSQITCQFNLVGAAEGAYDVVVTNPSMASGVLPEGFYVMGPVDEDFETGDLSKWPWVTYGDAMWTVSSADSHTGTYAARAGSMPTGGSSTLEITLDCLPGSLSFFRKLACPGGLLIFYVDGEAIGEWTGFTEWDTLPVQYEVAAGSHTFKREYWDVLGDPAGTVWLDDICFPPLTGVHTVAITSGPSGSPNPVGPNGDVICSVGAFDSLGHNLNYQWSCASGSFNDPTLPQPTWTAPATAGDHEITVTVTCSEDGTSSDTGSYVQQVADVVVTGINPDSGSNDGVVNVAIGGQGFEPGATAQLAKAGQLPIAGMGVTVVSGSQITCAFNLLGVAEGYWDVVVTNPGGESGVLRGGFNVTGAVDEDFETGNLSKWPWVTHGDSNWSVTGTDPRTGTYSAEAGGMWESGSAFLEITLDCEPGEISFYKKLYCLGGLVIFYVDGAPISEWSGITEWDATPFEYSVARGSHTFKWEYWDVLGDPLGYAWLDDISFPPIIGTHGVNIIAGPEGTPNPVASEGAVQCSVTASDSLGHALTYQWSADGGSFDDATLAAPTWTAPANATGTVAEYQISVTVTCAEDATVSDTASYTQQVSSIAHTVGISAGPAGD
ncbi:MAG: S8 family serine peptidase, partial [candidate division WS1 bacterium]|nr:S8 family serine peptidase [candidate division WS1 bacterium]